MKLNLTDDTIKLYWGTKFKLWFGTIDKKILDCKCFLDSDEVDLRFEDGKYCAYINPPSPSVHKVRFIILTNTGTNSIADKLGAENFQYNSKEWTIILKSFNAKVNMTYSVGPGGLLLNWKDFDGFGFKYYEVREVNSNKTAITQDNHYLCSDYVGELCGYEISVVDESNYECLWAYCYLPSQLPEMKLRVINGQFVLTWKSPVFKDNIVEYQVSQAYKDVNYTKIATLSNNDTSLVLAKPDVYCKQLDFKLVTVPRHPPEVYNAGFSSFLYFARLAYQGPSFSSLSAVTRSGFYYVTAGSYLTKYSFINGKTKVITGFRSGGNFSAFEKYYISHEGYILNLYDAISGNLLKSVNIGTIAPDLLYGHYPVISENGICAFCTDNALYVYDLINEKLIAKILSPAGSAKISPNGKYVLLNFFDNMSIYQISDDTLKYLNSSSHSASASVEFIPWQEELLYTYELNDIKIRSSQDLSVIRTMNVGPWLINIDFNTNQVLAAYDFYNWKIYDFNTGNLMKTIRTDCTTGAPNYTLLANDTIYFSGYKMRTDF